MLTPDTCEVRRGEDVSDCALPTTRDFHISSANTSADVASLTVSVSVSIHYNHFLLISRSTCPWVRESVRAGATRRWGVRRVSAAERDPPATWFIIMHFIYINVYMCETINWELCTERSISDIHLPLPVTYTFWTFSCEVAVRTFITRNTKNWFN